jgi:hypothetical protein
MSDSERLKSLHLRARDIPGAMKNTDEERVEDDIVARGQFGLEAEEAFWCTPDRQQMDKLCKDSLGLGQT